MLVGYDGNVPELVSPRDLGGEGKRDLPELENANTDRIRWLYRHGKISDVQYYAAERLQLDAQLATIGGYASGGNGGGNGPRGLADAKCDAMGRVNAARLSMVATAWRLVELVVLENNGLHVAGTRLWGHSGRGEPLGALRFGLDSLAAHYGMG